MLDARPEPVEGLNPLLPFKLMEGSRVKAFRNLLRPIR